MKNKIILITLIVIVIVETIFIGYFVTENKKLSSTNVSTEEKDNNTPNKEAVALFDLEPLVEFFGDNLYLTVIKFTSPENLLNEELDASTLVYDFLSINNFESKRVVNLGEQAQGPGYKYTIEEIKTYLKEKFNKEYTISELKEVFKYNYNENFKSYVGTGWSSSPVQVPPAIKDIYYQNGYYYIEYYHQMDSEKPGTMVVKKDNEKFYLYSNSGYNYY